ncbi:tehB: tellurite resistance protein TehB [Tepidimonas thermarum]|uniref:TehB: tellurite resistance protein TehB n=1 Tax=Tepidimonas thermarum TaxID=335431 RepID=A0A554WZ66_9BURK|nr:tehB: tellurite resistance protein TehB [Tepidimonas thermarum]
MTLSVHHDLPASPWITRFAPLLQALRAARPDPAEPVQALDLACGSGRHTRWLVAQGCQVTAVDRDAAALAHLADLDGPVQRVVADLENGPWPLAQRRFDVVLVTNYLWRALLPRIVQAVGDGGLLLYETFAQGNETVGKPSRPDFLLAPGELLRACAGLRVIAYEDGFLPEPPRFVQRIAAVRERAATTTPVRYPLA